MAVDKEALRKRRGAAVQLKLHVEDGDEIREMIPREGGLFFLTKNRVMRVRSPRPSTLNSNTRMPLGSKASICRGPSDPLVAPDNYPDYSHGGNLSR